METPIIPVIDGRHYVVGDDEDATLYAVDCTSTEAHSCTLCGNGIAPGVLHSAWTWEDDDILRGHPGCVAVQREIDIDEWDEGTLAERVRDYCTDGHGWKDAAIVEMERLRVAFPDADAQRVIEAASEMLVEELAERKAIDEDDG